MPDATAAPAATQFNVGMRRLRLPLLLFLALACRSATPTDGHLAAMLLATDDFAMIQHDWRELPAAVAPAIPTVRDVYAGETITIFVVFGGCAANANGTCDATVEYAVARPDGKPYGAPDRGPLWTGPPPAEGEMQLGQAHVELLVELGDPLGDYTIRATIRDRVSGDVIRLEQHLVVKANPGAVKT